MNSILPGLFFVFASSSLTAQFVYVNPLPDSKNHRPEVTIALNPGSDVMRESLDQPALFTLTGNISGAHQFKTILSTDGHTIVLKPAVPFSPGEEVTVHVADGIKTTARKTVSGTTFSFSILRTQQMVRPGQKFPEDDDLEGEGNSAAKLTNFPTYNILANNNPAPGSYFFCNKNEVDFGASYLTIMNNDESFYYSAENDNTPNDWKLNGNCTFTYFDQVRFTWMMMDTAFNVIDSFQCGNGLEPFTDAHEFRIYPDGHAYIEANDPQNIDMSQFVVGGDTAAIVRGFTVQRLDADHNVVFEWRSWDHFEFTDAVAPISLTSDYIDLIHGNSIEEDNDGNLLLNERHLCEITKVNSVTGDIMWRMGGENNMFTFMNDISFTPFYYQHYVRRLPNGHILLYNNNNYHLPQESSVKEYSVDETNHVAKLVWVYSHPYTNGHPVFGTAGGSAQRLANGNTVICWGKVTNQGNPNFTEVTSAGDIVFEFAFEDPNQVMYRVTKSLWQTCDEVPTNNNELPDDEMVTIFPNPSSGNFTLELLHAESEEVSIDVINTLGQKVFSSEEASPAGREIKIDLNELPSGVYFAQVKTGSEFSQKKILIER